MMMSSDLQRAYLELEISDKNLDYHQANADVSSSSALVEQEKIRQRRLHNDQKRALLDVRRLQEELEHIKAEQAPVAQAEPVSRGEYASAGIYVPQQRFEDLRLVCSSIGNQYLSEVPDCMTQRIGTWFELLHNALFNGDTPSVDLQECRRMLSEEIAKNSVRSLASLARKT